MHHNLPTDPEFRREICAIKGIPYTDPEPPVATPAAPETYTAVEVLSLIEAAVNERMRSFEQRMRNCWPNGRTCRCCGRSRTCVGAYVISKTG